MWSLLLCVHYDVVVLYVVSVVVIINCVVDGVCVGYVLCFVLLCFVLSYVVVVVFDVCSSVVCVFICDGYGRVVSDVVSVDVAFDATTVAIIQCHIVIGVAVCVVVAYDIVCYHYISTVVRRESTSVTCYVSNNVNAYCVVYDVGNMNVHSCDCIVDISVSLLQLLLMSLFC